jgi:hypothetical protein
MSRLIIVGRTRVLAKPLIANGAVVLLVVAACTQPPDWARYEDGSPIRAEEEQQASLVLDSFNSDPSLLALIQLRRGHDLCVACTLERELDAEVASLRRFLAKPQPPWAVERAESKLDLVSRYRAEQPFDEAQCPPVPCYEEPDLAAQQGDEDGR